MSYVIYYWFTYVNSRFVRGLHNMPHFNKHSVDHEIVYNGGLSHDAHDYYMSLIGFPILMACISVIIIVGLQVTQKKKDPKKLKLNPTFTPKNLTQLNRVSGVYVWTYSDPGCEAPWSIPIGSRRRDPDWDRCMDEW